MVTSSVSSSGTSSTTSTTMSSTQSDSSSSSETLDLDDFLQLMVTQMQYQDPLEPTDNTEYIAQMATFTQVEATTESVEKIEQSMASGLVGQNVIMKTNLNSSGYISGTVDYWENVSGTIYLGINGSMYDIDDLDTVMDADYYSQYTES